MILELTMFTTTYTTISWKTKSVESSIFSVKMFQFWFTMAKTTLSFRVQVLWNGSIGSDTQKSMNLKKVFLVHGRSKEKLSDQSSQQDCLSWESSTMLVIWCPWILLRLLWILLPALLKNTPNDCTYCLYLFNQINFDSNIFKCKYHKYIKSFPINWEIPWNII